MHNRNDVFFLLMDYFTLYRFFKVPFIRHSAHLQDIFSYYFSIINDHAPPLCTSHHTQTRAISPNPGDSPFPLNTAYYIYLTSSSMIPASILCSGSNLSESI